jgi:hypothetical protein
MKDIARRIKELIEASEPDMTVVEVKQDEFFACPIGEALWPQYREQNPEGLVVLPRAGEDCTHPHSDRILQACEWL